MNDKLLLDIAKAIGRSREELRAMIALVDEMFPQDLELTGRPGSTVGPVRYFGERGENVDTQDGHVS